VRWRFAYGSGFPALRCFVAIGCTFRTVARIGLLLAVLAVSTSAPLVRAAEPAPALTVAALRIGMAALLFSLAAGRGLAVFWKLALRERLLIVGAGVLMGLHFAVWIGSLYLTSTAASVALVATQPVFAAIFGHLTLGDRVGRWAIFGIAVAAVGSGVLAGGDWGGGSEAIIGDLLAVLGAAAAAGYLVVGRSVRVALPLTPYLAMVNLVAGVVLLGAAGLAGAPIGGLERHVYIAVAANAVLGSVVGHTLLNWSVRRFPTHLVTLAILGEPVGASLLTWGFFAERPPLHAVAGGAIILVGIAIGFARRGATTASEPP